MDELTTRAYHAYFKAAKKAGAYSPDQPNSGSSGPETVNGRQYVVLRDVRGILAVYRVRADGILRAMKRWPKALEEY